MTPIEVVGGLYGETCRFPAVEEIYGSGGRAAVALANAGYKVHWHYYCPLDRQREARDALAAPHVTHFPHDSPSQILFTYMHPLSRPIYFPGKIVASPPIRIEGDLVLRFGMMEGDAIVSARACVYDPQSLVPVPFANNGSEAKSLAVVLNTEEIIQYAGAADEAGAVERMATGLGCSVIVVKAGAEGCRVYEDGRLTATVPAYRSERVYKIGTGDVFSSAFASAWLVEGRQASASAEHASRCVARYAETRNASAAPQLSDRDRQRAPFRHKGVIRIIGSNLTMSDEWLIEEARDALLRLGAAVRTDSQNFERQRTEATNPIGDIETRSHTAVLALLDSEDPATFVEVGRAINSGLPMVAYARGESAKVLRRFYSPTLKVCDDFATALYHVIWEARA